MGRSGKKVKIYVDIREERSISQHPKEAGSEGDVFLSFQRGEGGRILNNPLGSMVH